MTQQPPRRPVPGPPAGQPQPAPGAASGAVPAAVPPATSTDLGAALAGRPVAEHVAVLEAEHARLQAELASIDRL
jgi:hypothetical protein